MTKRLFVSLLALGLAAVHTGKARADEPQSFINPEPLTNAANVAPFRVSDAFKVMLAAYKDDLKEIQADTRLTDDEKAVRANRIKARVAELLILHDRVVNISPLVFSVSLFLGAELPLSFLHNLVRIGVPAVEFAGGVTFALAKNRGTGKIAKLSVGLSTLIGPNLQIGPPAVSERRAGSTGFKTFLGVAAIVPMNDSMPTMRMGDLQGWYFGGAIEISTDKGVATITPKSVQIGAYAKLNQVIKFPQAGMIFAYRGLGASDKPITLQAEALHFGILTSTDGGQWQNPIPFTKGNSESPHNDANRREELKKLLPTADDIAERMKRVQAELESGK